jgi:hypothetical protein
MIIYEIKINLYFIIDIMRHFTKMILCKQFALISLKRNFLSFSVKGFANNFKNNK